jgi:hypothetical protein
MAVKENPDAERLILFQMNMEYASDISLLFLMLLLSVRLFYLSNIQNQRTSQTEDVAGF